MKKLEILFQRIEKKINVNEEIMTSSIDDETK